MSRLTTTARVAAIFLFATSVQAQTLNEIHILRADDGMVGAGFGERVAIDGSLALFGASGDGELGVSSGAAYLYDTSTGAQIFKLQASDGSAFGLFGFSVGMSDGRALVGRPGGGAYLFDVATGQETARLIQNGGLQCCDQFGFSLAISASMAVVSARWDSVNAMPNAGAIYLFDVLTGQQLRKVTPNDVGIGDTFGTAVALDGSTLLVGSPGDDDDGVNAGSAYLFDATNGQQLFKLLPADGFAGDMFGSSVAVEGSLALIGAPGRSTSGISAGLVYLFDVDTGQELGTLRQDDPREGDCFGAAVSISGVTGIVGAPDHADNGFGSGAAYAYNLVSQQQIAKLLPSDGMAADAFGRAVGLSGFTAVSGAAMHSVNQLEVGSGYSFAIQATETIVNNGASVNPIVLGDGGEGPVLGRTWPATVNPEASGHEISMSAGYPGSLPPGALILGVGEVIVDLFTVRLFEQTVIGAGLHDHSLFIPDEVALVGLELTVQALLYGGGPPLLLSNALDLTVGY